VVSAKCVLGERGPSPNLAEQEQQEQQEQQGSARAWGRGPYEAALQHRGIRAGGRGGGGGRPAAGGSEKPELGCCPVQP
jgi:hypothetical protein